MNSSEMLIHELAIVSQLRHHNYMPPLPAMMAQRAVADYQINNVLESAKTCWSMVRDDAEDYRTMRLLTLIKSVRFKRNGHWVMWVYQWGRDCDQCECDRMYTIPANLLAFNEAEDTMYDDAEGSCSMWIASEADHASFEPTFRDRRAEQYGY